MMNNMLGGLGKIVLASSLLMGHNLAYDQFPKTYRVEIKTNEGIEIVRLENYPPQKINSITYSGGTYILTVKKYNGGVCRYIDSNKDLKIEVLECDTEIIENGKTIIETKGYDLKTPKHNDKMKESQSQFEFYMKKLGMWMGKNKKVLARDTSEN